MRTALRLLRPLAVRPHARRLSVNVLVSAGVTSLALWTASSTNARASQPAASSEMQSLGSSVDSINHSLGFVLGHMDIHTPYQNTRR